MDLNKELVVIPLPSTLDIQHYYDYDDWAGTGGSDQIVLETEDGESVIVTSKKFEETVRDIISKAEKHMIQQEKDLNDILGG